MTTLAEDNSNDLWGHPRGLYICFATELWERFSFYGMKYLLLLYLTKYHLFSDAAGLGVLGSYASLVYAMPVLGGLIADRFIGMRKAVTFGGFLLVVGHLGMAFEGEAARQTAAGIVRDDQALSIFYLSLALIVVGVGFLKPNISTVVGKLYPEGDPRRDAGFTIFYMGINIGAFSATLLCGWLGEVPRVRARVRCGQILRATCMAGPGALARPVLACSLASSFSNGDNTPSWATVSLNTQSASRKALASQA